MALHEHYPAVIDRIDELVHAEGVDLGATVPACPEWTARDTVCHVAAVLTDVRDGRVPDTIPPSPAFTARQVEERRGRDLDDVIAEWRDAAASVDLAALGGIAVPIVLDAVSHEHDLRAALDRPGAREEPVVAELLDTLVSGWGAGLGDLPPFALDDGTRVRATGDGEPGLVLRGTTFELLRVLTARRSRAQARSLVAAGDFDRYADHLTLFAWPEADQPG